MIGDTELDILAGHEAGVHTVAVSWGYAGMDILKKASPEFIASNYDEFISIFKSFC
jgi:phosphoglycolate phosphatase